MSEKFTHDELEFLNRADSVIETEKILRKDDVIGMSPIELLGLLRAGYAIQTSEEDIN